MIIIHLLVVTSILYRHPTKFHKGYFSRQYYPDNWAAVKTNTLVGEESFRWRALYSNYKPWPTKYWEIASLYFWCTAVFQLASPRGLQSKLFTVTSWLLLLRSLGLLLIGRLRRLLRINEPSPWHCNCLNSRRRQGLSNLKAFSQVQELRFNLSSCYHCTNLLKLLEDVFGIALAVPRPGWPMFKL